MSSYLNKLPPPPPPPRAAPGSTAPPSLSPTLEQSQQPPLDAPAKRGHRHTESTHWNDLPTNLPRVGAGGGSQKRERVTSRAFAPPPGLASPPAVQQQRRASGSTSPGLVQPLPASQGPTGQVLTGAGVLPAFNAPPPPPPEPVTSFRYGPRGLPVEVVHFPPLISSSRQSDETTTSPSSSTKLVLLFIPGNPGLVSYYRSFLTSLRAALPSPLRESTELYAISHLGHCPSEAGKGGKGFAPREQASLEEQVEDKVRFLDELKMRHRLGEEGGTKLVVMGHSIGAWVGLQVLKERPYLISGIHLLFPTISHMSTTPNGRSLSPLFSSWTLRPVFYAVGALSILPTALISRLVSLLTGHTGSGAASTSSLVSSPATVLAALCMAREELAEVKELDVHGLRSAVEAGKVWAYYAAEGVDGWVEERSVKEVEEVVESVVGREEREKRVRRCKEGMPHAFVLDEAHTASLARRCATWIVEDLSSTSSTSPSSTTAAPPPPPPPAASTVA